MGIDHRGTYKMVDKKNLISAQKCQFHCSEHEFHGFVDHFRDTKRAEKTRFNTNFTVQAVKDL